MKNRAALYQSLFALFSFVFTRGLVLALWVVTIKYGVGPKLAGAFTDIAYNLTSAL